MAINLRVLEYICVYLYLLIVEQLFGYSVGKKTCIVLRSITTCMYVCLCV